MTTLLIIVYAFYLIMVGARGNANKLLELLGEEGQFISWIVIIAVVAGLGDIFNKKLGLSLLALILISFLLNSTNQAVFFGNLELVYKHFTEEE